MFAPIALKRIATAAVKQETRAFSKVCRCVICCVVWCRCVPSYVPLFFCGGTAALTIFSLYFSSSLAFLFSYMIS